MVPFLPRQTTQRSPSPCQPRSAVIRLERAFAAGRKDVLEPFVGAVQLPPPEGKPARQFHSSPFARQPNRRSPVFSFTYSPGLTGQGLPIIHPGNIPLPRSARGTRLDHTHISQRLLILCRNVACYTL
jgi:hypothetical protein